MEKLSLLILLLVTNLAVATEKPSCSNPDVVLSKLQIPCLDSYVNPNLRDIPELNIDFQNLDRIFKPINETLLGIESGGGVSGRQSSPERVVIPQSTFGYKLKFSCRASLLINAGKTVNYLLVDKFDLTHDKFSKAIYKSSWDYYVTNEENHNPKDKYSVPKKLNFDIGSYFVQIDDIKRKIVAEVCQVPQTKKSTTKTCSKTRGWRGARSLFVGKSSTQKLSSNKLVVNTTFELSCKRAR